MVVGLGFRLEGVSFGVCWNFTHLVDDDRHILHDVEVSWNFKCGLGFEVIVPVK